MTMMGLPFMTPVGQTSHQMRFTDQTTTLSSHINQRTGTNNNSMIMPTPVFAMGSNISNPSQFIQNNYKFSAPVPCSVLPDKTPDVLPVPTTSTRQPFIEESEPMSHETSLDSYMIQLPSYEISSIASNIHGQYLMESVQMVTPNLVPATKQDTKRGQIAAHNTAEQQRNNNNQATCRPITETYAKQQKESWFQQKQRQCDENQISDFLKNIEPQSYLQSHQDVDKGRVPLYQLPSSHYRVQTPIQTVSTAADMQWQIGKQIIQCFQHVCIFCILQCQLLFGFYTYVSA